MTFREHKWTQNTVSPKKKTKLIIACSPLLMKLHENRGTHCLFLEWRISTTNERNIPHLRKKSCSCHCTEQNSSGNETVDKESHSCVQVLLKLTFLWHGECLQTEQHKVLCPLNLQSFYGSVFVWHIQKSCWQKKNKMNICTFKRLKLIFSSMLFKWMIQLRPWANVFLFFFQAFADLRHGQGM